MDTKFKKGDKVWTFEFPDLEHCYVTEWFVDFAATGMNGETFYSLVINLDNPYLHTTRKGDWIFKTKQEAKAAALKEATENYEKIVQTLTKED